jgi:iron complex transport system ATP-binding protein
VGTLSGGERQRARLARALAQVADVRAADGGRHGRAAPRVGVALALDEPTAALDLAHEMAFFGLVRDLARAGTTVLLVTHNLNLAARYADHLVLLHAGRVAAAGPPAAVLAPDVVSRVYGWPVAVVPHPGPGRGRGLPQVVPLDLPDPPPAHAP